MTQNIEQRTEAAVSKYEGAAGKAEQFAETDSTVSTAAGPRKSFPKLSREIEADALESYRLGAANHQGNYAVGVAYDKPNWTYTYSGQQWGLSKDFDLSALPYETAFADPNNDPNLAVRGNASQAWVQSRDLVNILDHGARGGQPSASAIRAAYIEACLLGTGVYVPPSDEPYIYEDTTQIPITNSIVQVGEGIKSQIHWTGDDGTTPSLFNFDNGGVRIESFTSRGVYIRGSHDINVSNVTAYPFRVTNCRIVTITNSGCLYSRTMGIAVRSAEVAVLSKNKAQYCARDGLNAANCDLTTFFGNDISWTDDDAIGVHNQSYSEQRDHVIFGNKIRFAQGIKCLGIHNVSMNCNTLSFIFGGVFTVTTSDTGIEGVTPTFNVNITGNTVSNIFNRAAIDNLNQTGDVITISSRSARAGTLTAIPGELKPDFTVDSIYPYLRNQDDILETNTPIPNSRSINITGNTFMRDIPLSGLLSELGFGVFYTRNGFVDVDLSQSNAMNGSLLKSSYGTIDGLLFSGNIIDGINRGVHLATASKSKNWLVSKNIFTNMNQAVAFDPTANQHDITFSDNVVDLDPLLQDPNRLSNGGWSSEGDKTAILLQGASGLRLLDNTFKNCSRIVDGDYDALVKNGRIISQGNIVEQYPNSTPGFDTTNLGVGSVQFMGVKIFVVQADPTQAGYGELINEMLEESTSKPDNGYYLQSHFVRNKRISGVSSPAIIGWTRLTTGTAHVTGVDWQVLSVAF